MADYDGFSKVDNRIRYICPTSCFSFLAIVSTIFFAFGCRSFRFEGHAVEFTLFNSTPGTSPTLPSALQVALDVDDIQISPWYRRQMVLEATVASAAETGNVPLVTLELNNDNVCAKFLNEDDFDTKWTFVRAATIITPILGAILTVLVCATPFMTSLMHASWYCIAVQFILILTLFQGLTFLMLRSNACEGNSVGRSMKKILEQYAKDAGVNPDDFNRFENGTNPFDSSSSTLWDDDCKFDGGASINCLAIVCWFLAGATMFVVGAPPLDEEPPPGPLSSSTPEQPEQPQENPHHDDPSSKLAKDEGEIHS